MMAIRQLASLLKHEYVTGRATFVPVVNEAAFRWGSRMAADRLDLARVCPGDPRGSITHQVAHKLSQLICDCDYYIDLHTGGTQLSVYPLAGYMMHENHDVRDRQHAMARAFNLPLVWGTDATLSGRSLSVARDANVPAIYAEYLGGGGCHRLGVQAMVDGCQNVMASLGMLDRSPPPSRVQYDIQDARPESGFLQRSQLASFSGFFETAASLGDHMQAGETFGWIVDPLGRKRIEVLAETTGIVVCLRTFAAVEKNESLGYLIETETKVDE